jgi:hypothetical protein
MTHVFQNDKYVGDVRAVDGEIANLVERRMARLRWRHMIERVWVAHGTSFAALRFRQLLNC